MFPLVRSRRYVRNMSRRWTPNVGPWLKAQRGERLQATVIADLGARGVHIDRSWLSRIENGAPLSDELLAAFEDYYGSVPPSYEAVAAEQETDLASAIREQADAIAKMTEAINVAALAVLTSQASIEGGQVALGDLLARLAAGETLTELARSLQRGPER